MQAPSVVLAGSDRSRALRELGLLDTPPDPSFDRLTRLASRLVKVPTVLLTLADGEREVILSGAGMREPLATRRAVPLSHSFCRHIVASGTPMVLRDARHSRRVRGSPLIQEMSVVAYAGFPLRNSAAEVLGAFCAIDYLPRHWVPEELSVLEEFAAMASREVELREAVHQVGRADGARRRAEATLSAATPFRTLVEQCQVGIYAVREGRFRYTNPSFASTFGYSSAELAELPGVLELVAPTDRGAVVAALDHGLRRDGGNARLAFSGVRRDGTLVRVEAQGTRLSFGGRTAVVGTLLDVTAAAQAQEALRASEERYRQLFEDDLTGDCVSTPDGRIVACNPAFVRMFGFGSREEALRTRAVELYPSPEVRASLIERVRSEGRVELHELELRRRDGTPIRVVENLVGVRDDGGELCELRAYLFDITERTRAEEAVRRNERLFRAIFDGTFQFCGLLAPTGTVVAVNRTVLEFAGCGSDDLVGLPCWEAGWWVPRPDREERLRAALDRTAAGESVRSEEEVRGADGRVAVIDFCLRPMVAEGGRAELIIFEGWDITERRRIQAALEESEERLRLVERATNDVIWDWDPATGRLLWNETGPRRFRYAADEVEGSIEWHTARVHPEDRERVVGSLHEVVSGVVDFWSEEYRFLRGDGSYAAVLDRAYVVRNARGEAVRVIGSMMDVSERRRNEEAQRFLSRASALLDASLEIGGTLAGLARLCVPALADYCLIDLVDEEGGLRRAAVAHADPSREELLDRDQYHDADADPGRHPVVRVVRRREPLIVADFDAAALRAISHDAEHARRLRRLGLCSYMIVPLLAHDHVLGAITLGSTSSGRRFRPVDLVLAEDLAQRAALAIENATLYERARRAVGTRDEVLGMVSHDLRSPLNTITMVAALLGETANERRSESLQWLDLIRRSAEQMNRMIGDLLDASSIEAGRFSVAPAGRAVAELLREAREMLEPLASAKQIRLEWSAAEGMPTVWVDSIQILRVLANLVGNALKFTPDGGTVTVHAERGDGEVCFSVSDTGPGIPAADQEHVFDRYWQARSGDRRGAGLGLAIAQGIVAAHGGRIWVESSPGSGATFRFTVPVHDGPAGAEAA